jgi:hypothetical protein
MPPETPMSTSVAAWNGTYDNTYGMYLVGTIEVHSHRFPAGVRTQKTANSEGLKTQSIKSMTPTIMQAILLACIYPKFSPTTSDNEDYQASLVAEEA